MTTDELVDYLAGMDLRRLRTPDLLAEVDFAVYELGDLARKGDFDSGYAQYIEKRARVLSGELDRRAQIMRGRDTPVPSIPLDFIIMVKGLVDIEDVFNRFLGIFCRPTSPTRTVYPCPAHPDKHPSGVIYRDQGRYHCYQCRADGDCFDALMAFKGMTFPEAVDTIAGYLGLSMPQPRRRTTGKGVVPL